MKRQDDTLGLEALRRVRAEAVSRAASELRAVARELSLSEERQRAALDALAAARTLRSETLAAETQSNQAVRIADLVARGAWLERVELELAQLALGAGTQRLEVERAQAAVEAWKMTLARARADLRVVEARAEDAAARAERSRENVAEEDAHEAHLVRRA